MSGKKHNKLTTSQANLLQAWIECHWDSLQNTQEEVANRAASVLGFRVTASNIRSAVQALGRVWPRGRGPKNGDCSDVDMVKSILRIVNRMDRNIAAILNDLNTPSPEEEDIV